MTPQLFEFLTSSEPNKKLFFNSLLLAHCTHPASCALSTSLLLFLYSHDTTDEEDRAEKFSSQKKRKKRSSNHNVGSDDNVGDPNASRRQQEDSRSVKTTGSISSIALIAKLNKENALLIKKNALLLEQKQQAGNEFNYMVDKYGRKKKKLRGCMKERDECESLLRKRGKVAPRHINARTATALKGDIKKHVFKNAKFIRTPGEVDQCIATALVDHEHAILKQKGFKMEEFLINYAPHAKNAINQKRQYSQFVMKTRLESKSNIIMIRVCCSCHHCVFTPLL